jgi:type IV pilus assembly protein PilV
MRRLSLRPSAGFSLLEVLVAIVILSLGLLGFASLLSLSLQTNQSANHRTEATNLAYEIIDRIRANRPNAQEGHYNTLFANGSATVTGTTRARVDLREWKQRVEALLPGGQAQVNVANGVVTVNIRWADARWEEATADQQTAFAVTSQI